MSNRIGSNHGYNHINTLAQRNKLVANTLLDTLNGKKKTASSLTDFFTKTTSDNGLYTNYADILKTERYKNTRNSLSLDSLRIDPSQPLQTPPEREYVQMEAVTKDQIDFAQTYINDRVKYSEMFLGGLGDDVFNKYLSDNGVVLPEGATFDISVDGYGKVTVTGLADDELTNKLQDTMSYDFSFIRSVLTMFEESKRTIENNAKDGGMGMSSDQHWKMKINSELMSDYGVNLTDLRLDSKGKIQGLPDELYNKIYGSREGMSRVESDYLDLLRDKIGYFINKGADNVSEYGVLLSYEKGKVSTN